MLAIARRAASSFVLGSVIALAAHAQSPCEQWKPGFEVPGVLGDVYDVVAFDDGTGLALYAGGRIALAGDEPASTLAKWDGTRWHAVPGAPLDSVILDMVVLDDGSSFGPALYVIGGGTTPTGSIARWNGATWDDVGGGIDVGTYGGHVRQLVAFDPDGTGPLHERLVAVGPFTTAGGLPIGQRAIWDGSTWAPLAGSDGFDQFCTSWSSAPNGPAVVGPHWFFPAQANELRAWNASGWSTVPGRFDGLIEQVVAFDDGAFERLFVLGSFRHVGNVAATVIAYRDTQGWHDASMGIPPELVARPSLGRLVVHDDGSGARLVLVSTELSSSPTNEAPVHLADWTNGAWVRRPDSLAGVLTGALSTSSRGVPGELIVLGAAVHTRRSPGSSLLRAVGSTFEPLGDHGLGLDGEVTSLGVFDLPLAPGPALYVGGYFRQALGTAASSFVRWDGVDARDVADPEAQYGPVALAAFDDGGGKRLYAAYGDGYDVFGQPGHVGRFDGASWSSIDAGIRESDAFGSFGIVDDGTGAGRRLFLTGELHTGCATLSDHVVVVWNGSSWSSYGGDVEGRANAIAEFDDGAGPRLHVAGALRFFGTNTHATACRWDGTSWTPLGPYLGEASSLVVFDDGTGPHLYAGGYFFAPWTSGTEGVMRWDGAQWTQVGSGVPSSVRALAVHDFGNGPELVAAGDSLSSTQPTAFVARWDGASWRGLGTGLTGSVQEGPVASALATFRGDLYVGGSFTQAGGRASANLAVFGCAESVPEFCAGDGVDPQVSTPCPCANFGAHFHGCANSVDADGAHLSYTGSTVSDSIVLTASGMPATALCGFIEADQAALGGLPFGDGVHCLAGNLRRIKSRTCAAGVARLPIAGEPSLSVQGLTPPGSGVLERYQVWYRNSAQAFCPPSTSNATNGLQLTW